MDFLPASRRDPIMESLDPYDGKEVVDNNQDHTHGHQTRDEHSQGVHDVTMTSPQTKQPADTCTSQCY